MAAITYSLQAANEKTRGVSVDYLIGQQSREEYILYGFDAVFANIYCETWEDTGTVNKFGVNSNVTKDDSGVTVHADQQTWSIDLECFGPGDRRSSTRIDIEKTLLGDGTGRAFIGGNVDVGRDARCDVNFDVEFDAFSGNVISGTGTLCGKDVSQDLVDLVVPGFSQEELLQPAQQ